MSLVNFNNKLTINNDIQTFSLLINEQFDVAFNSLVTNRRIGHSEIMPVPAFGDVVTAFSGQELKLPSGLKISTKEPMSIIDNCLVVLNRPSISPCPFCNSNVQFSFNNSHPANSTEFKVKCTCGYVNGDIAKAKHLDTAINLWNDFAADNY